MGGCSAVNCSNHSRNKHRMFKFPADPERRKLWIINCRRDAWVPSRHAALCSAHFEESQFEQHRAEKWKKLKQTAIPTLFNVPNPPAVIGPLRIKGIGKPKPGSILASRINDETQKKDTAQENLTSSEDEQREETAVPTQTFVQMAMPPKVLPGHRQSILRIDPKILPTTTTGITQHNTASQKIYLPSQTVQLPTVLSSSKPIWEADEFTHFGNNIACQLRSMPLEKALLCQLEIMESCSKYRFENCSSSSPPSSPSPPIVVAEKDITTPLPTFSRNSLLVTESIKIENP